MACFPLRMRCESFTNSLSSPARMLCTISQMVLTVVMALRRRGSGLLT